jgi:thioredoxin reductase
MSKVASEVYLVHRSESFRAFDILVSEVMKKKNINIYTNTEVRHIVGEDKVEKIIIFDKSENKEREIAVDGVFIEIGRIASTDLLADFVERDEKAQIIAKANMETKTPGIFAAGDVVSCEFKQITIAMGQATIAALSAYQYIQMNEK